MFSGRSSEGRGARERKTSILEVFVDDPTAVEVVDGIKEGANESDGVVRNSKPS